MKRILLPAMALSGLLAFSACDDAATAPAAPVVPPVPTVVDTAPAPRIDPAGGFFSQAVTARLLSPDSGAQVRCTMDGSTPIDSSPLCQDSVRIAASVTLKARAFKEGSVPSRIDSARFVIDVRQTYALPGAWIANTAIPTTLVLGKDSSLEIASIPTSVSFASPAERTHGAWQLRDSLLAFTLVASDTSADGTHWFPAAPPSQPTVSFTFRLSGDSLFLTSSGQTASFRRQPPARVPMPRILPATDTFGSPQSIVLQGDLAGATIRYTLDGSAPTEASAAYSGPFSLGKDATLKAAAFAPGLRPSEVSSRNFVFLPSVQGSWKAPQGPSLSYEFAEDGSTLYIAIDSASPWGVRAKGTWHYSESRVCMEYSRIDTTADSGRTWIFAQFEEAYNCESYSLVRDTLRFLSPYDTTTLVRAGAAPVLKEAVASPLASLPEGAVMGGQSLVLSCATPGAVIRYAINGMVSDTSPIYAGTPIRIDASTWITAIATKPGLRSSGMIHLEYMVDPRGKQPDTTFTDARDGHVYSAVKIGSQTWMAENLAYASDSSWCYDDDTALCTKYGRLYNQSAALAGAPRSVSVPSLVQGICPTGWHLPSRGEWDILMAHEGGEDSAGTALLALSATGTDKHGLALLLGGTRSLDGFTREPFYHGDVSSGYYWTASRDYLRFDYKSRFVTDYVDNPENAHSVRCLLN